MDECASWGNKCSQICHNVKGSYKCSCHEHFVMVETGSLGLCVATRKLINVNSFSFCVALLLLNRFVQFTEHCYD